jgi:hypothetical protein
MDDMSYSTGMALILAACLVAYVIWCALTARPSRRWIKRMQRMEEGRARQIVSQAAKSKSDSQKERARVQFAKAMIKVERDTLKEMKNMRGMD